jgi:hypothetical protein
MLQNTHGIPRSYCWQDDYADCFSSSEVGKSVANAERVLKETRDELHGVRPPLPWPQTLLFTFGLVAVMYAVVYTIISGPMLDAQRKTVAEKYEQLVQQDIES